MVDRLGGRESIFLISHTKSVKIWEKWLTNLGWRERLATVPGGPVRRAVAAVL
jgi:hypothetical protein